MFTRVELYAQSSESFTLTDYSILEHWAAHPWKRDMADSVPATIRMNYRPDTSLADIFFIHPTSYLDVGKPFGWNAPVDDPELNKMTDEGSILFQASIFNEAGRVFAPRYQQANIEAYFTLNQAASERALNNAYADVKAAFQYYLAHYNNGRPIVIASHSQGSTHSQRLVKELFDGKALQSQLVVAYIIGMDVNPSQYVNTTECTKPLQNACVCSWRTYETGYIPLYIKLEQFKSIVTNPLTWDSSAPSAARSKNLGSTLINFNLIQPGLVNADAKAKVLWVETGPLKNIIPTSDFHSSDMNLYYMNIRENVKERIDAWYAVKKKKEKSYNLTDPLFMEQ
jgi:hypothetical protein